MKSIKVPRWRVISKLLAGSLVIHLLLVVCVLYIPGVRAAFNLASLIADTKFVDKPYQRTEIGDNVELVNLTSEKFHYPEGYFAPEGQVIAMTFAFANPIAIPCSGAAAATGAAGVWPVTLPAPITDCDVFSHS